MKKNLLGKIAAGFMAAAMVVSLTACGGSGSGANDSTGSASGKEYKVGIVKWVDDASLDQIQDNIQKELDAKGEELGVTFNYADYTENAGADGSVLGQMAIDLLSKDVDIFIPIATPTATIIQSATEDADVPIVFAASSDPVGAKLVASMEEPGANITGTSDALNTEAVANLMLAQNPELKKVGLLYSKSEDASTKAIADAKKIFKEKGIETIEKTGTNNNEIASAADSLVAEKVDAIFTPTDNTVMTAELAIYEKLMAAGIPHYAGADSFALNGAFCGYGVNYADLGKATADMAVDILVNGADPATTPVMTFDNGIATINTEVAEGLKIDLDQVKAAFEEYCSAINETVTQESFE